MSSSAPAPGTARAVARAPDPTVASGGELVQWDALAPSQLARLPDGRPVLLGLTRHLEPTAGPASSPRPLTPRASRPCGRASRWGCGATTRSSTPGCRGQGDPHRRPRPGPGPRPHHRAPGGEPVPRGPGHGPLRARPGEAPGVDPHRRPQGPRLRRRHPQGHRRPQARRLRPRLRGPAGVGGAEPQVPPPRRGAEGRRPEGHRPRPRRRLGGGPGPQVRGHGGPHGGRLRRRHPQAPVEAHPPRRLDPFPPSPFLAPPPSPPRRPTSPTRATWRFANGRLYFAHMVALDVLDARTGKLVGTLGEK